MKRFAQTGQTTSEEFFINFFCHECYSWGPRRSLKTSCFAVFHYKQCRGSDCGIRHKINLDSGNMCRYSFAMHNVTYGRYKTKRSLIIAFPTNITYKFSPHLVCLNIWVRLAPQACNPSLKVHAHAVKQFSILDLTMCMNMRYVLRDAASSAITHMHALTNTQTHYRSRFIGGRWLTCCAVEEIRKAKMSWHRQFIPDTPEGHRVLFSTSASKNCTLTSQTHATLNKLRMETCAAVHCLTPAQALCKHIVLLPQPSRFAYTVVFNWMITLETPSAQ